MPRLVVIPVKNICLYVKIMGSKALNSLYANSKKHKLHSIGNQMFFKRTVKPTSSSKNEIEAQGILRP